MTELGIWPTVALIGILSLLLIYALYRYIKNRKLHKRWVALRKECNAIIFERTSPGTFRDCITNLLYTSEATFKACKNEKAFKIGLANAINRLAESQEKANLDRVDHLTQIYYEQYQSQNN